MTARRDEFGQVWLSGEWGWGRFGFGGAAKAAESYEEKQRFGEPEGAVGKAGWCPCVLQI